jgi:hypothetical protein
MVAKCPPKQHKAKPITVKIVFKRNDREKTENSSELVGVVSKRLSNAVKSPVTISMSMVTSPSRNDPESAQIS